MSRKERIVEYDMIRAVSALMILVFHFSTTLEDYGVQGFINFGLYYANGRLGSVAVVMFFMLSGACLYLQTSGDGKLNLWLYARKRWKSIYPMFYFCYLIAFTLLWFGTGGQSSFLRNREHWTIVQTLLGFDGYFRYTSANYYLIGEWFLGAIILCYGFFPLLRICVRKNALLTTIVCAIVFWLNLLFSPSQMEKFNQLPSVLLAFELGMVYEKHRARIGTKIVAASAILTAVFLFVSISLNTGVTVDPVVLVFLCGISMFVVLAYVGRETLAPTRDMKHLQKSVGFLSKYSYASFLCHHLFIYFAIRPFLQLTMTFSLGIVLLAAYLACVFFISFITQRLLTHLLQIFHLGIYIE